ncbi:cytochrome-c peroxidase, partial [Burkholderia diffusa]
MHSLLKSFAFARSLIPAAATLALMGGLAPLAGCDARPGANAQAVSVVSAAQAAPAAPATP